MKYRTLLQIISSVVAVCGGSCGGSGKAAFVGTWNGSGSYSATCPSGNFTIPMETTYTITDAGSFYINVNGTHCNQDYVVYGNVATLGAAVDCLAAPFPSGGEWSVLPRSVTLTVNGHTLVVSGSGDGQHLSELPGSTEYCKYTTQGTYSQ